MNQTPRLHNRAHYQAADVTRHVAEKPKSGGFPNSDQGQRSEFERDRARVLHSFALRRLAATTQVRTPGEEDFPRTRLTHSLEVAQIGREIGAALGCDPDLVDAACLAHDLGHPPFGHNGEAALDNIAQSCGGFEGNAQTLRILTRLEPKVLDSKGKSAGLNLTRAVLDASVKYPWQRPADAKGPVKFGVYADDLLIFQWIREESPGQRRCLETQVMDWADDVAYSVHDVEDGIHSGLIRFDQLADRDERQIVCALVAEQYSSLTSDQLGGVLDNLLALPVLQAVARYDSGLTAQVALKQATSELTHRFVTAAVNATRDVAGHAPLRRYDADLTVPVQIMAECALLKGVAAHYVMRRSAAEQIQRRQRDILEELAAELIKRGPGEIEPSLQLELENAANDQARSRVVIDQIARLTDTSAIVWHQRLIG